MAIYVLIDSNNSGSQANGVSPLLLYKNDISEMNTFEKGENLIS